MLRAGEMIISSCHRAHEVADVKTESVFVALGIVLAVISVCGVSTY